MLSSPTIDKLKEMKLTGMVQALEDQMQQRGHEKMSFEERLGLLVDKEHLYRENRKLSARLRRARLKQDACIEDIDFSASRGLNRQTIMKLAKCNWVREHHNIIITGLTGVGKSFVSCALAHKACLEGYTARYMRAPRLFNELEMARADGRYEKVLKTLAKVDILIVDDWGLSKLSSREERELLEVMEDRYEMKSTIIASQVPVKDWHGLIPNKTIADAVLDRIVHNSYRIEIAGDSMRKEKNSKEEM